MERIEKLRLTSENLTGAIQAVLDKHGSNIYFICSLLIRSDDGKIESVVSNNLSDKDEEIITYLEAIIHNFKREKFEDV